MWPRNISRHNETVSGSTEGGLVSKTWPLCTAQVLSTTMDEDKSSKLQQGNLLVPPILTAASLSNRANSSFRVMTSSCAVHWDARLVNPSMSAKRILQRQRENRRSNICSSKKCTSPAQLIASIFHSAPANAHLPLPRLPVRFARRLTVGHLDWPFKKQTFRDTITAMSYSTIVNPMTQLHYHANGTEDQSGATHWRSMVMKDIHNLMKPTNKSSAYKRESERVVWHSSMRTR